MIRTMVGACLLAMPLLVSCSFHDDYPECNNSEVDMGEYSNLKLIINLNSDTSARTRTGDLSDNPMGGEDGNGLRVGEHHENDIDNLCVFAFADLGGNRGVAELPDNTPVKYCRYIGDVNFKPTYANTYYQDPISTEVDIKFEGKIVDSDDAFLVVANMGDLTAENTLGAIRDYLVTKTLTRPAEGQPLAKCTSFSMANAHNSCNLGGKGTQTDPYKVSIDLERTTARVDFMFASTLDDDNKPANLPDAPLLGYNVVDRYNNANQIGWMYISHIKLMNVAQNAPYALKRLAYKEGTDGESGLAYLADEEHDFNDEATKYVVEPYTWEKGKVDIITSSQFYSDLYGSTRIQYVSELHPSTFTSREAVRNYATPETYPNDKDGFNNGWSKDRISKESYYVLDYINENTVEKEYTNGRNTTSLLLKTKFVPKEMYYINGSELSTKAAAYGDTFWAMEKLEAGKREKLYFANEAAATAYKTANPSATYGAPVEYTAGDSYYTIWIRHDNNGNDALIGKMEYGIVRNNIYRIGVSKVLGPGSPLPVANENPEDINLHIYVRKWNLMTVPTINI